MITLEEIQKLREYALAATSGKWAVVELDCASKEEAVEHFRFQVENTQNSVDKFYLINANDKCPAIFGCGPTSEKNADFSAVFSPENCLKLLDILQEYVGKADHT